MSGTNAFGPLHPSATPTRPAARADTFGARTFFRDASQAGSTDGTVLDASWLNALIGNLSHLCDAAGIVPADQAVDTYLADAVTALIAASLPAVAYLLTVAVDPTTLAGDGRPGTPIALNAATQAQLASIAGFATALASEQFRAQTQEASLAARIAVLESGAAPRATITSPGFVQLNATGTAVTGYTLI